MGTECEVTHVPCKCPAEGMHLGGPTCTQADKATHPVGCLPVCTIIPGSFCRAAINVEMEATRGFLSWGLTRHVAERSTCLHHEPVLSPCVFTLWLEVGCENSGLLLT